MSIDVSQFSQDDLAQLRQLLSGGTDSFGLDALGRSPNKPRQLQDLRLMPTATDPRPTFYMSAESPRHAGDLTKTKPYPRLMWDASGKEITVASRTAQETYTAQGYVLVAPSDVAPADPVEDMTEALNALSEADRKALLASVQADKIAALQAKMAALSPEQLDAVLATATEGEPEKRGPGRPRKEAV